MFLDIKIKNWFNRIDKNIKLAFVSTIILGIICHAFMMTNKWLNLDDIVQLVDSMERTSSGRWFLMFPSWIGSEFSLPWLNGLLTIFYSAIISSIIVKIFNINSKLNAILIGGIIVTFPSIASLMPFMNTQDSYQFGAMLSIIASYLIVKKDNGFLWAIIFLTLSLAIYQAYLGFSAGIILIYLMIEIFNNKNFKSILYLIIKTAISFISSILLYLFVSRVIFGHLLVDYKGLSTMGSIPILKLPEIILNAYIKFFTFFLGKEFNYHFIFMPILFCISMFLIAFLIIFIVKKSDICKENKILLLLILFAFPLTINIIYVMSFEEGVMLRMAYGYTICFIFPLILIEHIENNYQNAFFSINKNSLTNYSIWFLTITIMLSIYNNIYVSNKTYFKIWITNKTSDAYANRIVMRLEMIDGYTKNTPIVFLGNPDSRTDFTKEIDTRDLEPLVIANHLTRLYSFKYYPKRFLGLQNPIEDEAEMTDELRLYEDEIKNMPIYPAKNSIKMIDGTIYIKFKEID